MFMVSEGDRPADFVNMVLRRRRTEPRNVELAVLMSSPSRLPVLGDVRISAHGDAGPFFDSSKKTGRLQQGADRGEFCFRSVWRSRIRSYICTQQDNVMYAVPAATAIASGEARPWYEREDERVPY